MHGDIQYITDTFLLDDFFREINSSINEEGFQKKAFDLSSVINSIGSSIKQYVGGQVHGKDSAGVARTVTNLLAPAVFFRLHPILGMAVTAAQLFGFDLFTIYQKIMGVISPQIRSGQPVTAEQVNSAARSAIPAAGLTMSASIGNNGFLYPLKELKERNILKEVVGQAGRPGSLLHDIVPPGKNVNPLVRAFSFLSPQRRGSLLVGILVWFIKTVLLSAGLLVAGGSVLSMIGVGDKKPGTTPVPSRSPGAAAVRPPSSVPAVGLSTTQLSQRPSSGIGGFAQRKGPNDIWIEVLGGQKPHERILQWVFESYPNLYEYKDIILRTPSFWSAVRAVTSNWRPGQTQLEIPKPFNKRDDVLKLFINDVFNNKGI